MSAAMSSRRDNGRQTQSKIVRGLVNRPRVCGGTGGGRAEAN